MDRWANVKASRQCHICHILDTKQGWPWLVFEWETTKEDGGLSCKFSYLGKNWYRRKSVCHHVRKNSVHLAGTKCPAAIHLAK